MATSTELEDSVARFFGRSHGTKAPFLRAISAISVSSVETITSHISCILVAVFIDQLISGSPPSSFMFFRGSRWDPPLAGIRARILIEIVGNLH